MSATSRFGRRFTVKAAAAFLDCTPAHVYRLIRRGTITYQRATLSSGARRGSNYSLYEQDLIAFLEQTRVVATQPGMQLRQTGRSIAHLMPAERELS